ncbi:MAG: hypothetical protein NZM44_07630 [Candidatus Calescibacterium sp.]|nr:hypothetical protein [Candidatus Calescibacterium sp.]
MVIFFENTGGELKQINFIPEVSRSEKRILRYSIDGEEIIYIVNCDEEYPFLSEDNFERRIRIRNVFFENKNAVVNFPKLHTDCFSYQEKDFVYWKNYLSKFLTEKQSICLAFYIIGFDTTEIGKKLNISKQAVQKSINFAKKKLRNIFGVEERTYDWQEVYEEMISFR